MKNENTSLKLIAKGTNNSIISDEGAGISLEDNATINIQGTTQNAGDSKLEIKAGIKEINYGEEKGNVVGVGCEAGQKCGEIKIENITVDICGGWNNYDGHTFAGAPAIGIGGGLSNYDAYGKCGNITITNSIATVEGGHGAAAIGTGDTFGSIEVGNIIITKSTIYAKVKNQTLFEHTGYGACIGLGVVDYMGNIKSKCGEIRITTTDGGDAEFMKNLERVSEKGYKIGYGDGCKDGYAPYTFGGVWINDTRMDTGNNEGKGYSGS